MKKLKKPRKDGNYYGPFSEMGSVVKLMSSEEKKLVVRYTKEVKGSFNKVYPSFLDLLRAAVHPQF